MFSKKPKAYSVYLFFRFCFSLLLSMATVLSMVYHLEVVGLGPFQLVLVGTVLETSCFLFEVPTGVVATCTAAGARCSSASSSMGLVSSWRAPCPGLGPCCWPR